ncbi:DUF11 domain-containing protein [Streptomyces fulvoviolaceus]|uniref:DUF11 domain-containing protein n=1 Tax=Streptomyces fulvoviolaceus TaxID=285535 RepID=UPI0021BFF13B|nr:DUF11 domain-containing protein [Streptomyces fulvoviolaceus]MCT9083028.1 DUF11 domain-containing protein [Streptomyces fulvoviolaceus]
MAKRISSTAVGAAVVLLAPLTACTAGDMGSPSPSPSLSVPEVYYLRPHGDKVGLKDKMPFALVAKDDGDELGVRKLTVDVPREAQDTVRLKKYGACTGDSAHLTCEVDGDYSNWSDSPRAKTVAAKGAKAGDTALVRYTYTTKDGKKLTARTKFVVGEPVVEAVAPESMKNIRPGSELVSPVVVRNTGEVPVKGLGLELGANNMDFAEWYDNCRYPPQNRNHIAVCEFPKLRIDPGETVVLRPALNLRVRKTVMYPSYGRDVWALDAGPGHYATVPKGGDLGDGPTLEAEATKDPAYTKGAFVGGGGSTYLVVDTHADYEVSDVDLHGDPGTERTFQIKVRNNGPADGTPAELVFDPPLGLTIVKQPMSEYDDGVYEPYCDNNGYTYTCDVRGLDPGDTQSFEFTAHLGDPGEGTLDLQEKDRTSPWDIGRQDPDASNDEAVIKVSP